MARVLTVTVRAGSEAVLDRLLGLLRRRCIPLRGISFGIARDGGPAPVHLALDTTDPHTVGQALAHLRRLPDVLSVNEAAEAGRERELALVQVNVARDDQVRLLGETDPLNTRLLSVSDDRMVLEVVCPPPDIDALVDRLGTFGPVAVCRSGVVPTPAQGRDQLRE